MMLPCMRVCFVISNSFAANAFLEAPVCALARRGWAVTVVADFADGAPSEGLRANARIVQSNHRRDIAPLHDLVALARLWAYFRREAFDVVHSITPKAGLLAMLAARLAGVQRRLHTFTGQVWASRTGPMRWLLRTVDRFFAACATQVLADSGSQRDFIAAEGVAKIDRIQVLAQGSICGVDIGRFRPDAAVREGVRARLGIEPDAPVTVFLGRLHVDKGLAELGAALRLVAAAVPQARLLLAGPDEGGLAVCMAAAREAAGRVSVLGQVTNPDEVLAAADIFCLPSYREGFGLSLIEAAACGLPCVATRIYGVTDAVIDGRTGLLVPPRDALALAAALRALIEDPATRREMGEAARGRVVDGFSQDVVVGAWLQLYADQLGKAHQWS